MSKKTDSYLPLLFTRAVGKGIQIGMWVAVSFFIIHCAGAAPKVDSTEKTEATPVESEENALKDSLEKGIGLIKAGMFQPAITLHFNPIIAKMERTHNNPDTQYYCATTQSMVLIYMLSHASKAKENKDLKPNAAAISPIWSEAHYYKAFALIELKDIDGAQASLEAAVELSPMDSRYLSELAYIHQIKKDWQTAKDLFSEALVCTTMLGDEDSKPVINAKTRAMRGIGYCLFEMNDLEGAEKWYRDALAIDPNDEISKAELKLIDEKKKATQ